MGQPLAFFSKQLRPRETKYSTFDRELLGLYLAIRHFKFYIEGRNFTSYTDHKPLVGAMSKISDPWTARQQRQLAYISEFSTDIRHISGKTNVVVDCLSRPASAIELTDVTLGIDYAAMATAQTQDPDCRASQTAITELKIVLIPIQGSEQQLLCDTSTGQPRPLVPRDFFSAKFRHNPQSSTHTSEFHGKTCATKIRMAWSQKQVSQLAKECLACHQSKIQTHIRAPMSKITVPTKKFTHIHIDLVGPLPPSEGYSYLLTIIDRTTRLPEAIPINKTSTSECAKTLIRHWISRFGVQLDMTSDRGPQFTSVLWNDIADKLGISIHRTCAYHPQSNGLAERFHRLLEAALKAHLHGPYWVDELPWVLLGLRTVP